tara:strand:- start:847 stop:978 length:132 start_codon:yes stop_codon:yes gene_type:complete
MTSEKLFKKLTKFFRKYGLEYVVSERAGNVITIRFWCEDEKEG